MSQIEINEALNSYSKTRNPESLGRLFDLAAESLFKSALQLMPSAEEAEEALQETFLFLIASPSSFKSGRPAMPYLTGVLQKKCLELRRREGRRQKKAVADETWAAREKSGITAITDELRLALNNLPTNYKDVLLPVVDEGMKPAQIAARMGETPAMVRSRIHRALGMLRDALPAGFALPAAFVILEGTSLAAVRAEVVQTALGAKTTAAATTAAASGMGLTMKLSSLAAALLLVVSIPLALKTFSDEDHRDLSSPDSGKELAALVNRGEARRDTKLEVAADLDSRPKSDRSSTTASKADPVLTKALNAENENAFEMGEISFHYQQGWSFSRKSVVDEKEEADIWFESCAGGISSITYKAANGIRQLGLPAQEIQGRPASSDCYLRAVAGFQEDLAMKDEYRCDSRRAESDVFLFKTRRGAYGVAAIIERGSKGGWQEYPVTLRYRLNEQEPVFSKEPLPSFNDQGIAVDPRAFERDLQREALEAEWLSRVAKVENLIAPIDRKAMDLALDGAAEGGTVVALHDRKLIDAIMGNIEDALGLRENRAYVLSSYSFEHQTRDDVKTTRNDWDFAFENYRNGTIRVRTVTDDRSQIWDLGAAPLTEVGTQLRPQEPGAERQTIQVGNSYLIHTLDTGSNLTARMKVLDYKVGQYMIFSWLPCDREHALALINMDPALQMKSATVRLQMRGGAGGGNPNRVFLDGSKNAYLDKIVERPIQIDGAIDINERAQAYIEGGRIPHGQVWRIHSIDYRGTTRGDSNGPGEFILKIGNKTIAEIKESEEPFQGRWNGDLVLKPGDELKSFAEIANSSACDVIILGTFQDE